MLQRHKPWVREDDDILLLHVRKHGPNDWVRISQLMGHPSPQQCRERYYQYLSLALNNSPITPEEGVLIYKWKEEIGRQWPEIARRLGNRSSFAVENWWYANLSSPKYKIPQQRKGLRRAEPKKDMHSPAVAKRCLRVENTGNSRLHFRSQMLTTETKRRNETLTHGSSIGNVESSRPGESPTPQDINNRKHLESIGARVYDQFDPGTFRSDQMPDILTAISESDYPWDVFDNAFPPPSPSSVAYGTSGQPGSTSTISSSEVQLPFGQVFTQNGASESNPQANISKSQISMKNTAFYSSLSDSSSHTPKLFISSTISQDCTGSEDANRASLLIALKERPSGLKFRIAHLSNGVTKRRHLW